MSYNIFLILIIIVAVLLVLIIMVQNPKGGGLSSSFGGGSGAQSLGGGVQSTTNFLDKSTWTLSIALLALILVSNISAPRGNNVQEDTLIQNTIDDREVQDFNNEETPTTTVPDSLQ
ncbi:MAG: preprotein translocase subunit SecG [Urechidicola sp.]|nr:preprotein translocase subunit SecG [Urechidicola sp.]